MVKGSMQQQLVALMESMIIKIYAPNIGTPRYIRQVSGLQKSTENVHRSLPNIHNFSYY